MATFTDAMPEWSVDINFLLGGAIRILAGMAVFQGAADVVECRGAADVTAKYCLVSNVVLSASAALVPLLIYKFYQKVVLRFKAWTARKIRQ